MDKKLNEMVMDENDPDYLIAVRTSLEEQGLLDESTAPE